MPHRLTVSPFREPPPLTIAPPNQEPLVRVGVVLREDNRHELSLTPTVPGYRCRLDDGSWQRIEPGVTVRLTMSDAGVLLTGLGVALRGKKLEIVAPVGAPLKPQQGMKLAPLIAGRTFHWRKEVEQVLPGNLEFTVEGQSLIGVNSLSFEDYCVCVIASEMGHDCPKEFLCAQATAARSWAWVFLRNKHPGAPFQICNDDDCQRYQGTTFLSEAVATAVQETRGEYLVDPGGAVLPAYYSKSCGGSSEPATGVFGFSVPCLEAVADRPGEQGVGSTTAWIEGEFPECYCSEQTVPRSTLSRFLGAVDETRPYFRWNYEVRESELAAILNGKLGTDIINGVREILVGERGPSGRILNATIECTCSDGATETIVVSSQYDLRKLLHQSFLLSSAFLHEWRGSEKQRTLHLRGAGWGHGVGLCQIGAVGMSLKGIGWRKILAHYFPGSRLHRVSG